MRHPLRQPLTPAARDLVASNFGLSRSLAFAYYRRFPTSDLDELDSEAQLALCLAASAFDPSRGKKFSAYAGEAIRNALWHVFHPKLSVRKGRGLHRVIIEIDDLPSAASSAIEAIDNLDEARDALSKISKRRAWHFRHQYSSLLSTG